MRLPGLLALGLTAILYGATALTANPSRAAGLDADERAAISAMRAGSMQRLVIRDQPAERLDIGFENADGRRLTLSDFAGKVVVLNVWATWCPPCRAEMPSLDRLAGMVRADGIEVVALSTDRGGLPKVRGFFDEIGVKNLPIYTDPANEIARKAALVGLPVTLILDRQGREVARLTGDAEWDSDEAVAILRRIAGATRTTHKAQFKKVPGADQPRLTQ